MSASDRDDAPAAALPGDSVQLSSRQRAAAKLRAARLTDDPAERELLRRQAAELIEPRRKIRPPGLTRGDDRVR